MRATLLVAFTLSLSACLSAQTAPAPTVVKVDTEYGTLRFRGTIDRTDVGVAWEFRPHLVLTFQKDDKLNTVAHIDLQSSFVVASLRRPGDQRAKVLFRDEKPTRLSFGEFGQTQRLPDVVFRVDKTAAADANSLMMGVGDGRLIWPIAVPLR